MESVSTPSSWSDNMIGIGIRKFEPTSSSLLSPNGNEIVREMRFHNYHSRCIRSEEYEMQLGDKQIPFRYSQWSLAPPLGSSGKGSGSQQVSEIGKITAMVPLWRRDTGELLWGGERIAKFDVRLQPTRFELVLQAFQKAGWEFSVANPLGSRIHEVLCRLNQKVKSIHFHAQESGKTICWLRDWNSN